MQDILLWGMLAGDTAGDDRATQRLRALLAELAALPINERWPYFGRIGAALAHPVADVRAAALNLLAGAGGLLAYRAITRALHDPERSVREAAVTALGSSAASDTARWAHAAFHPLADVRRHALDHPPGKHLPWYAMLLLPDDACREVVRDLPVEKVPPGNVFAALELARRGLLTREAAAEAIAEMPIEELYSLLSRSGPWRSDDAVAALLTAAGSDGRASAIVSTLRADSTADVLEELLTLFWRSEPVSPLLPESTPPARERFFARLVTWAIDRSRRSAGDRVLCALLMSAVRAGGAWDPLVAELALLLQPKFLEFRWVDPSVRRAAVDALYRYGTRLDPLPDAQIESLLRGPLCQSGDRLDLWVVGGILRWAAGEPYKLAERAFGIGTIVDSFLARPAEFAPFFSIPKDPHGRSRILDVITARSRHSTGAIFAGLILVSNADELSFLDNLDGRDALGVYQSLLAITTGASAAELSENKVRRLAETLSPKLHPAHLEETLRATVDTPGAELDPLALRLLSTLARDAGAAQTVAAVRRLEPQRINRLLEILPGCAGFPYGVEILLAHSLKTHKDAGIRAWCAGRVTAPPAADGSAACPNTSVVRLSDAARKDIATCSTAALGTAVAPCLKVPTVGLTAALAARVPPGMHSIATCLALLGCHDPVDEVAEQFATFSADEPEFLKKLDAAAVKQWCWNERLPLLGNCWMHLWDPHCFAAGAVLVGWRGGVAGALRWALGLPSIVLCRQVFDTVARLMAMWRWRERSKLAGLDLAALCPFLVDALPGDMGLPAAKALATVYESRVATEVLDGLQPRVSSMLADLTEAQRGVLQAWVDARGLAAAAVRRFTVPADPHVLRRIARSRDPGELESFCRGQSNQEVQDAALRLIELGEAGLRRLAALLTASHPEQLPPLAVVIAESIPLWSEGGSLAAVREWLIGATAGSELLLTVGLGFLERGDAAVAGVLIALCAAPCEATWFRQDHWNRLLALGVPERALALGLATSPHPYAYQNALEVLLRLKDREVDDRVTRAVLAFLETDGGRRHELRVRAAQWLKRRGNHAGFPLLLLDSMAAKPDERAVAGAERDRVLVGLPAALVEQAVRAVLHAGPKIADEARLLELLDHAGVDATARDEAYTALVKDASLDRTRAHVVSHMRPGTSRAQKLRRLAHTFAWGVVTGREITGRVFAVEMNAGGGLGHTRLETDKVWISPLPILCGEQHAEAVTRGLIVHEFGHHMYHRTPEALAVWEEATKDGYHGLLNLVSDEHLERNLRALDDRFGDDLKKLASYAFQHADKEVPLNALLVSLQARAFDVLAASDLRVARRRGCVLVNNGRLLAEMERAGMSFSRFVRALRMGLGNRGADEKVVAGLELFKGMKFRKRTMPELKALTLRLRDIFGWEAVLMESFAQDALLSPDAADVMAGGEGITGDELREAVRRLLEDRTRGRARRDKAGPPVKLLNVGPEESFAPITTVVPVPFDPAQHAAYAGQVAGPARQMRRYLAQLGLRMEPQRYRVQGKRVDRARVVPAGILRGDPRLLVARKMRIEADLFLGLIIDCSGSMQMSSHMQKAKLFGTMLAEAAKGLDGIDVRVFGFTDSVIYDAGDARHCAAHALEAAGGNNDAAALWHGALAARASRRRAKLLVMISDGSPTECTTNALKALVSRLSHRMNICCAQLAVCPLDVKCFPHYVELVEENVGDSVRRFGSVVQRLVQKAIRGR